MIARRTRRGAYLLEPFRGEERICYAVASELWDGRSWAPDIHYVQAHTASEARRLFLNTQPGLGRFVAVAPAVGFYRTSEKADSFTADPEPDPVTGNETPLHGAA